MIFRALKFLEITRGKLDRASEMSPSQLCFIYGAQGEIFFFKGKVSSIKRMLGNYQSRALQIITPCKIEKTFTFHEGW